MTEQEFLAKMKEDILDTETDLTMDMNLSDIEEWDSLSFVGFIALAKTLGVNNLDRNTIRDAVTVCDLYNLLK